MKKVSQSNYGLFLFLLFTTSIWSQSTFIGQIVDSKNENIPMALVQTLDRDTINILAYTFADKEGKYQITISGKEEIIFKISSYNFEDLIVKKEVTNNKNELNFILTEKSTELKEVIVISHQRTAKISNDSISFNLKTIRDSTETNLGDLIKKLPGLEIASDGKVKFQGITIDRILIDGQEFFGNKHKIATENIGANMVEGIDLLLKHSDNINLKEFGENSKIALNIKLDSRNKNLLIGNLEVAGGISEKYTSHSNIFKFMKNGNISLITDFNNVGELPLTVPDYFDIIGGAESIVDQSNSLTNVSEMIPDYIYNEDKRRERSNLFSALNIAFKTKDFKFNSNIFFNSFNQLEQQLNNRFFLDNTIPPISEIYLKKSSFLLFSSIFKMQYVINKNSNFKFLLNFVPSNGDSTQDIISVYKYDTSSIENNMVVSSQISYQYRINKKFLFASELAYKKDKISNSLAILSSDSNLYNLNLSSFDQKYLYNNSHFNSSNSLLFKNNKNKYKYTLSLRTSDEHLQTALVGTFFENNIQRSFKEVSNKVDITHYITEKIFLKYQIVQNLVFINLDEKNLFENYISFNYNLNAANNFSLSYQNKNSIVELIRQLKSPFILDYYTINIPMNIENNPFINKKTFSIGYNNYGKRAEQFITINLNYSFANQNNTTITNYVDTYSLFSNYFGVDYDNFYGVLIYDRRFIKAPLQLKSTLSTDYTSTTNFINSKANISKVSKNIFNLSLVSSFKNLKTQFQLSYLAEYSSLQQSLIPESYSLTSQNVGLKIISKVNSFKVEPSFNYLFQNGTLESNYQTLLNLNVNFVDKQQRFTYFIHGSNLLNIDKFEQITQTSNNIIFENTIHSMIPGYVLLGIKYNF